MPWKDKTDVEKAEELRIRDMFRGNPSIEELQRRGVYTPEESQAARDAYTKLKARPVPAPQRVNIETRLSDQIAAIRATIRGYHFDLDNGLRAGLAAREAIAAISDILSMSYIPGEEQDRCRKPIT
jgi:hypothetical protein